ncbi:hypothetical protein JL721_13068 [Aureococcus anophagefferens]|nr:hypothetical protein JL721_13068 [Aureococcus anophagefferens]
MRSIPALTMDDIVAMLPVAFCSMMAHCASVFALSAGAVSSGQIVKAAEPAFAAVLSQFVYGKPISQAKWLWQRNKKLMETPGLKDRLGSVGNQFAITSLLAFLMSLPLMFATEGAKFGEFMEVLKTNPAVKSNFLLSGVYFYGYNELATMTIKKTNAITQCASIANQDAPSGAAPAAPAPRLRA